MGPMNRGPGLLGRYTEHLHVAGALSNVGGERVGQVGWNLKDISCQTGGLNSTHMAMKRVRDF